MVYSQFVNKPSLEELYYLSKDQLENPQKYIYSFFDRYGLGSSHNRLWHMLRLTISSEEINEWNEVKLASCIHFYELLSQLLKANYLLFLKMRNKTDER
ncbi:MAG: hypothetical protein EOP48_01365 [Sphingobacteriales bacterium]|nr:MAG: hypothetical protein EOP48_01365 [Sphingobacteriales bacterium]